MFATSAVKPWINREKCKPVVVRAGQIVRLDIDVKGEPPPKITWTMAGKELSTDAHHRIENEDYNTRLQISDTSRKQTGKYVIRAVNDSGSDEAEIDITILGEFLGDYVLQ